jgi:hypothetical protein
MTLKYCSNQTVYGLMEILQKINNILKPVARPNKQFQIYLNKIRMFGARNDIRVLTPSKEIFWPEWINEITSKNWNPHVACFDDSLRLTISHVAVMSRKDEIVKWKFQ